MDHQNDGVPPDNSYIQRIPPCRVTHQPHHTQQTSVLSQQHQQSFPRHASRLQSHRASSDCIAKSKCHKSLLSSSRLSPSQSISLHKPHLFTLHTCPPNQTKHQTSSSVFPPSRNNHIRLLDLPPEVFELILKHATDARDGVVPFTSWPLTAVCTRFRQTIYSLISRVDLVTCYDYLQTYSTRQSYVEVAAKIMAAPLQRCRKLHHFNIAGCDSLTDAQVGRFLRTCPPLRSFTAVICLKQTDHILDDLSQRSASHLHQLDLSGCDRLRHGLHFPFRQESTPFHPCSALSDLALQHVGDRCHNLRTIYLSKALSITDLGLRSLGLLARLENILLRRLTGITNEGISYLADGKGKLKSFQLLSCGSISDAGLMAVAHGRATRQLQLVAVSFNPFVTDNGVRALARNLLLLQELQCDHCASLKESWCRKMFDQVGPLRRLSFRGVSLQITRRGIMDLTRIARLESLNLAYVGTINAELLTLLKDMAPMLRTLILEACSKVDDEAAAVLGEFTSLRALDVSWCSSLTSCGVHTIAVGPLGRGVQRLCLGPVNGPERGSVLYVVGRECVKLEQLELCGEVDENAIEWLKQNTSAVIEYAEVVLKRSKRRIHSMPVSPSEVNPTMAGL